MIINIKYHQNIKEKYLNGKNFYMKDIEFNLSFYMKEWKKLNQVIAVH
jgi:hypothetical protein